MRAYTYPGLGLWCASNALTCATLARDGLLDVLLSADNVMVCCCWRCLCAAFLQALWRALARGQVRWDGDGACLGEAAHLFGFMMRAMLRYLRNTRGACGKAESARNLGRTALRCLTLKFQAAAGCVGRCHDAGNWDELRLGA